MANIKPIRKAFGLVKYYAPTMGKTTAAKINPKLVDFDDIVRSPSNDILRKYGFDSKYQMFKSGNEQALKEYQDMLVKYMEDFRYNPENEGKTLLVSQSPVVNPEITGFYFDNEPSIPSEKNFIKRNVDRGGSWWDSKDWRDNLLKRNPNLKIDDRFVSEIENTISTLRRKISRGQFTKIIENNGIVTPLNSEGKQLRFTSAKPRKSEFYIETEVPVAETLFPETSLPDKFSIRPMSTRFKATRDFRPNVFDSSVKVFKRTNNGRYILLDKEQLIDPNLLEFGISSKPIRTEKPIILNSHRIHLPESPTLTSNGSTLYLDEALSPYLKDRSLPDSFKLPTDIFKDFGYYYKSPYSNEVVYPHGSKNNLAVQILKNKINTINPTSGVAESLIGPAKKHYLENYDVATDALTDEEWGKLMQTLLDKNSDKEILFHSTNTPFTKVLKSELLKRNEGFLGRGFYTTDIPQNQYGDITIPITMPKGKQIVLDYNKYGFLHADNTDADKLLANLRRPMVRFSSSKGFVSSPFGPWPGMKETSKSPEAWNQLIKDLDLNFVKSKISSAWYGGGFKYPEVLIPENKVDQIEMLFKAPGELKQGGKIK